MAQQGRDKDATPKTFFIGRCLMRFPSFYRIWHLGSPNAPAYLRLVDLIVVVNPRSVGLPYGTTGARWALLDDTDHTLIQARRTR